jgi:hypothetical protein
MSDTCDGMRVVGKCLINFLIPCFEAGCVWRWRNIPQAVCFFFMRKKYTTFSNERIVALWSVNNTFTESYDFAIKLSYVSEENAVFFTAVEYKLNDCKLLS